MEALKAEAERTIWTLRLETSGLWGSAMARRSFSIRLASLQRSLTDGARRRWAVVATSLDLAGYATVRDVVQRWRVEDEQRREEAEADLWRLGAEPLANPLDAKLWEAYFDSIASERPLATAAAAAIWDELHRAALQLARRSRLSSRRRFSSGASGSSRLDEFISACRFEDLDEEQYSQIVEEASHGATIGLRLIRSALGSSDAEMPALLESRSTRWVAGQQ
jgi:hypothetical protein